MIIDFHTHAFPEKIAPRALSHLSDVAGGLEYYTDGTVDGVLRNMERGGVDASVVLSIATNPGQTHSVNDFAAKINDKKRIYHI